MPFDIEDPNPVTRFFFDEGNVEASEWVELRLCPEDKTSEIRKAVGIKQRVEYQKDRARLHRIEYVDVNDEKMEKFVDSVNDYCIVNWHIVDKKGKEIPFTTENKKLMMGRSPLFNSFVTENIEFMRRSITKVKESVTENLQTTQSD